MWNWMWLEIRAEDHGVFPTIGEGGLTRAAAHEFIQRQLDEVSAHNPALRDVAARWRRGAQDGTVYAGLNTWVIYEHEEADPTKAATVWLDGYAETMRGAGLNVAVHWPEN